MAYFQSFLAQYKGAENLKGEVSKAKQLLIDIEIEDYSSDQYFTKYSKVNSIQTVTILNNQSMLHFITKSDIFNKLKESSTFSFNNRYLINVFHSIILDTGAAKISITGEL